MPDNRPGSPDRKLTFIAPLIIGGLVIVLFLATLLLRGGDRAPPAPPPSAAPAAPGDSGVALPVVVTPPLLVDRSVLIERAAAAAAGYAAGEPRAPGKDPLIGRRFTVRIPFGCDGPQAASAAQAYTEYDAARKTIKLVARPAAWANLPVIQSLAQASVPEDVEGFWLPRPWTPSESCPPHSDATPPPTPTPPAAQSLGLASLFTRDGSRVLRRDGRPYEFVRKAPDDGTALLTHSYRLVLEGRLAGYDDGAAVKCHGESPDHRPVCVYAVSFDRVAFEDADSGDVLAEWRE